MHENQNILISFKHLNSTTRGHVTILELCLCAIVSCFIWELSYCFVLRGVRGQLNGIFYDNGFMVFYRQQSCNGDCY